MNVHLGLPNVTKAPKVVATKVRKVNSGDQAILSRGGNDGGKDDMLPPREGSPVDVGGFNPFEKY